MIHEPFDASQRSKTVLKNTNGDIVGDIDRWKDIQNDHSSRNTQLWNNDSTRSFNEKGHEHNANIACALYAVAAQEVLAATSAMEEICRSIVIVRDVHDSNRGSNELLCVMPSNSTLRIAKICHRLCYTTRKK